MTYDEQAWTNNLEDEQAQGRTDFGMNMDKSQRLCVSLRQQTTTAGRDILN